MVRLGEDREALRLAERPSLQNRKSCPQRTANVDAKCYSLENRVAGQTLDDQTLDDQKTQDGYRNVQCLRQSYH